MEWRAKLLRALLDTLERGDGKMNRISALAAALRSMGEYELSADQVEMVRNAQVKAEYRRAVGKCRGLRGGLRKGLGQVGPELAGWGS